MDFTVRPPRRACACRIAHALVQVTCRALRQRWPCSRGRRCRALETGEVGSTPHIRTGTMDWLCRPTHERSPRPLRCHGWMDPMHKLDETTARPSPRRPCSLHFWGWPSPRECSRRGAELPRRPKRTFKSARRRALRLPRAHAEGEMQPGVWAAIAISLVFVAIAVTCVVIGRRRRAQRGAASPINEIYTRHLADVVVHVQACDVDTAQATATMTASPVPDVFNSRRASAREQTRALEFLQQTGLEKKVVRPEELSPVRLLSKSDFEPLWLVVQDARMLAVRRLVLPVADHYYERWLQDLQLQYRLRHENIVEVVGVEYIHESASIHPLYEHVSRGSLESWLARRRTRRSVEWGTWTETKLQIALGILKALEYVHSLQPAVVHGHLKSTNVLLTHEHRVKLCGFGSVPISIQDVDGNGGLWAAPEVLSGHSSPSDPSVDMYAFGVIVSELDTHQQPFAPSSKGVPCSTLAHSIITKRIVPVFTDGCPRALLQLGRQCLDHEPAKRPSATQAAQIISRLLHEHADSKRSPTS